LTNLANKLNEALKETPEAKDYFELKKQIEDNDYLSKLLILIQDEQKSANECLLNNDIEKYKIKKGTLKVLEEKFSTHPLIVNYLNAKNDMYQVIEQVISIISDN